MLTARLWDGTGGFSASANAQNISGSIGGTPGYQLLDNFAYTGAGVKNLGNGANRQFSIDAGTSLLRIYNDSSSNGLDVVDWASGQSVEAVEDMRGRIPMTGCLRRDS